MADVPTPAQLAQQLRRTRDGRYAPRTHAEAPVALDYTPPAHKRASDHPELKRPMIPAAREVAADLGLTDKDLELVLEHPDEVMPARNDCTWYVRQGLTLLEGRDGVLLAVRSGSDRISPGDVVGDEPPMGATARAWARRLDVDAQQIIDTVENPHQVQPGLRDCTWYTRGEISVLQAPDETVLLVRRGFPPRPHETSGAARAKVRSKGGGWSPPSDPRQFREMLSELGFQMQMRGSGHYLVTHPDVPDAQVSIPSTPRSAGRWAKNSAAQIRRAFGIDLRPEGR